MIWIATLVGVFAAYLLGSIPAGYLAGRVKGIDIREHGSKSTGATNVLRVLGPWPAAVVFLVDVLKGAAAVLLARWLVSAIGEPSWEPWAVCLAGLTAILGHARPVWLNFAGGKSVATGLGVLLAVSWPVGLGGLAVFAIALAIWRIVSLGSILASVTATILVFALGNPLPYQLLVIAGALYVIVRHRANIGRLLAGTEPKLGKLT